MTELYLCLLRRFWRILAEPRLVAVVRQIKWWQYCLLACIQWEFNSQLRNSRQERSVFDWLLILFLSRWRVKVYHAFIMNISQIFYYIPSHYSVLCPFKYYPDANRKQCSYIIKIQKIMFIPILFCSRVGSNLASQSARSIVSESKRSWNDGGQFEF